MPVATAAFVGYFGFHAFSGSYGLWAKDRLEQEQAVLTSRLADLKRERQRLEERIASVHPASLDMEVVDMAARTALNMIRPDEIVVPLGAVQ